ncbi:MAG: membrane lipoprotein lipid attachment site-containing protein [Woeseiaceae bacterium]|nr:membrane lipoprotein lipid attachment site-containing protein [Woeseiaceae bacterium]
MKKTILTLFLAAALTACASTGDGQAGEGSEQVASADSEEKQKMRCYREKGTGFRLGGKRVCVPAED